MPNKFVTLHSKQLRRLPTRQLALAIQLQHDELASGLFDRQTQLFE
jgi:hypothetical protein